MVFTTVSAWTSGSDIKVSLHESGISIDRLVLDSYFSLTLLDPAGRRLPNMTWVDLASFVPAGAPPTEVDIDTSWPRGAPGRYTLVVSYAGLGQFERAINVP